MPPSTFEPKKKVWKLPEISDPSRELIAVAGGSEILARLLMRRGLKDAAAAEAFLDPSKYEPTPPSAFADMGKAIERIKKSIEKKERITVYGDYDVDGVTATSVMLTTLKKLGANVDYYIPNRASEGYGLNLKAVSILASKHRSKLIITCDCGISNFAEINLAKSLGVETIIVDHHSMPEVLPPAHAILHPKQLDENHPLFHLPGVGVAYKLAEGLFIDSGLNNEVPKLLDFVTLGMIADMVPLINENRYLVQIGLPLLASSERAGIRALLNNTVKMDGTDIVGFGLAPRINAVGRLADASLAVDLMTVEDDGQAHDLAHQLELENARRQELCEQIFMEADLKAKQALAQGNDQALALYSASWHHGVVGIVASRLVEKYHCPVFVAELDSEEGKIKGSCRGVPGIDLYQILKANEHLLTKWGGHQMAAGFSAEATNADLLCRSLVETCNKALKGKANKPVIDIDLIAEASEINLDLAKTLAKLGPFGMWNKKPVIMMERLTVTSCRPLGKEGKHHKLILSSDDGQHSFECVYWRSSAGFVPEEGERVDLAFNPELNVFNKTERLQLVLCDWRLQGVVVIEEEDDDDEILDFTPPKEGEESRPSLQAPNSNKELEQRNPKPGAVEPAPVKEDPAARSKKPVLHLETQYDGENASTRINDISYEGSSSADLAHTDLANTDLDLAYADLAYADLDDDTAQAMSGIIHGGDQADGAIAESTEAVKEATAKTVETVDLPRAELAPVPKKPESKLIEIVWKDLREYTDAASVIDAAVRKLGSQLKIYAEATKSNYQLANRTELGQCQHLIIYQYPPSMQVFRSIVKASQARTIYLSGAASVESYDPAAFLKRLFAMVRYAVNQCEGQAESDKLCAGLATSKMALALGLTILKKVNVVDWYAEDSCIFMDIIGEPGQPFQDLAEYRQLANTLEEIGEFRAWCAQAPLDEIQSELVPDAIRLQIQRTNQDGLDYEPNSRANNYDRPLEPRKS